MLRRVSAAANAVPQFMAQTRSITRSSQGPLPGRDLSGAALSDKSKHPQIMAKQHKPLPGITSTLNQQTDEVVRAKDAYGGKSSSPGLDIAEGNVPAGSSPRSFTDEPVATSPGGSFSAQGFESNMSDFTVERKRYADEMLRETRNVNRIEEELAANEALKAQRSGEKVEYWRGKVVTDEMRAEAVRAYWKSVGRFSIWGITFVTMLKVFPTIAGPMPLVYLLRTWGIFPSKTNFVKGYYYYYMSMALGFWVFCWTYVVQEPTEAEQRQYVTALDFIFGPPPPVVRPGLQARYER